MRHYQGFQSPSVPCHQLLFHLMQLEVIIFSLRKASLTRHNSCLSAASLGHQCGAPSFPSSANRGMDGTLAQDCSRVSSESHWGPGQNCQLLLAPEKFSLLLFFMFCFFFFLNSDSLNELKTSPVPKMVSPLSLFSWGPVLLFWLLNAKRGSDLGLGHPETSGWHPVSKCQPSNTKLFPSPAGVLSGISSFPPTPAGIASTQVLKSVDCNIKLEWFLGHR